MASEPTPILEERGVENAYPRWSSDGSRILYQSNAIGRWQLYLMDADGTGRTRFTTHDSNNSLPDWSPDGRRICFVSDRTGDEDIYVINLDGTGLRNLTAHPARDIHPYWTPDGARILFNRQFEDGTLAISAMPFPTPAEARD